MEVSAGQFEAAQPLCDLTPETDWFRSVRAVVAAGREDCAGARGIIQGIPQTRFTREIQASCLIKEHRWKEARAAVDELLVADPHDPEVLLLSLALASSDAQRHEVLGSLDGGEGVATHSILWTLMPPEFKKAFPRR